MSPTEVKAIRAEVRAFCEQQVAPVAWDIGHTEEAVSAFPAPLFKAMADAGLFRIPFAAGVGGRGLQHPATATAVVIEELSYFSNSVAAIYDVHCILAGHALEWANPALQQQYLAPLLSGEKIGSFATSEPETSTDLSVESLVTGAEVGYRPQYLRQGVYRLT
ncbi:butyryl-CoA dehydrogenase [Halopseudomonas bauzanensis]|nr:butyryl-CoA dehydrogenase [Halopseudomonas bauzanensis]